MLKTINVFIRPRRPEGRGSVGCGGRSWVLRGGGGRGDGPRICRGEAVSGHLAQRMGGGGERPSFSIIAPFCSPVIRATLRGSAGSAGTAGIREQVPGWQGEGRTGPRELSAGGTPFRAPGHPGALSPSCRGLSCATPIPALVGGQGQGRAGGQPASRQREEAADLLQHQLPPLQAPRPWPRRPLYRAPVPTSRVVP